MNIGFVISTEPGKGGVPSVFGIGVYVYDEDGRTGIGEQ